MFDWWRCGWQHVPHAASTGWYSCKTLLKRTKMQVAASAQARTGQGDSGWGWGRLQINYESENNVITWNPIDEHGAQCHKKALKTRAARKCNWHFYNVLVTKERQPCRCCWPRTAGKVRLRNMTNICYNRLIVAVASPAVSGSLFGSCVTRLRTRECRWASGNCWMALNGLLCQRMQSSSVRTQVLPVQIVKDKYRSGLPDGQRLLGICQKE